MSYMMLMLYRAAIGQRCHTVLLILQLLLWGFTGRFYFSIEFLLLDDIFS